MEARRKAKQKKKNKKPNANVPTRIGGEDFPQNFES
jgi:hypothetical protein